MERASRIGPYCVMNDGTVSAPVRCGMRLKIGFSGDAAGSAALGIRYRENHPNRQCSASILGSLAGSEAGDPGARGSKPARGRSDATVEIRRDSWPFPTGPIALHRVDVGGVTGRVGAVCKMIGLKSAASFAISNTDTPIRGRGDT